MPQQKKVNIRITSRIFRFISGLPIIFLALALLPTTQAVAHIAVDDMQLDGDAVNTPLPPGHPFAAAPYDWDDVCDETGVCSGTGDSNSLISRFIEDDGVTGTANGQFLQTGSDSSYWAGGNTDSMPFSQLGCTIKNNPQEKSNLMHFFANFYQHEFHPGQPELVGFGGSILEEQEGTSTFGFWLLQDKNIGCDSSASGLWTGVKQQNDILLVGDVSGGGPLLRAYMWTDPTPLSPESGDECLGDGVDCSVLHKDQPFADGFDCTDPSFVDPNTSVLCAVVNTVPAASAWGVIPENSLFEATIDFDHFLPGLTYNTFLAESRASNSLTAQIKDYMLLSIDLTSSTLKIKKVANTPGSFDFTASPVLGNFSLVTDGSKLFSDVSPDTYTITETLPVVSAPQAWVISDIQCIAPSDPNSPITGNLGTGSVELDIGLADDAICTFTNFLEDPSIDIEKATNGADADVAPGPSIPIGGSVDWTYVVTNSGNVDLINVAVVDDKGVTVDCSGQTTLAAGANMTCTASGVASSGAYENTATVTADSPSDNEVTDSDLSHYFGSNPGLSIQKSTNGTDADDAPGPSLLVGSTVNWSYLVTNTGNVDLTNVAVIDDKGVTVDCSGQTTLFVGANMTCTASGVAISGQYENLGTVSANGGANSTIVASDPSHYLGVTPSIDIEKYTNGEDADTPTGPLIMVGDLVHWDFYVTNTGEIRLDNITVTDSSLGSITCPQSSLEVDEFMICDIEGVAVADQHTNTATVVGTPSIGGDPVNDNDISHYYGIDAAIEVEKSTNGVDADVAPGPIIPVGATVTWTYEVRNIGGQELTGIELEDDQLGIIICPSDSLLAGEAMTCSATGTAGYGSYQNIATVGGVPVPFGDVVTDTDPSHYTSGAAVIPTLTQWALVLLAMMLALLVVLRLRQQQ